MSRARARLDAALANGELYEAQQLYRTLVHRYKTQRKYAEAKELVIEGVTKLAEKQEFTAAAELSLMLLDVLKAEGQTSCEDIILPLLPLFGHDEAKYRVILRSQEFMQENAGAKSAALSFAAARNYCDDGIPERAYTFFLKALAYEDREAVAQLAADIVVSWSSKSDGPDFGRLLLKTVLSICKHADEQLAAKATDLALEQHPSTQRKAPPYGNSLVNLARYVHLTLEREAGPLFQTLRHRYSANIGPDEEILSLLDDVGAKYYKIKRANSSSTAPGLSGLLGSLLKAP